MFLELKKFWKKGYEIHLISFCGKSRAIQTTEIIKEEKMDQVFTKMRFVKDKLAKAIICRHIGIDIMIDDSKDVLLSVKNEVPNVLRYWFENRSKEWDALVEELFEQNSQLKESGSARNKGTGEKITKYIYNL
jgi:hypothetical protein